MYVMGVEGLAERLSLRINNSGMTVSEISRKTGIRRKCIFAYMNGENTPGALRLARLCTVLSVSADYLLFGRSNNER